MLTFGERSVVHRVVYTIYERNLDTLQDRTLLLLTRSTIYERDVYDFQFMKSTFMNSRHDSLVYERHVEQCRLFRRVCALEGAVFEEGRGLARTLYTLQSPA